MKDESRSNWHSFFKNALGKIYSLILPFMWQIFMWKYKDFKSITLCFYIFRSQDKKKYHFFKQIAKTNLLKLNKQLFD